jgi:hypothetical protein
MLYCTVHSVTPVFLYQTLCCLYSTALTLPYILYCTVQSVTPVGCTKLSAHFTEPISHSPICFTVEFTQSRLFAIPNTLLSVQSRSHSPLYAVLYSSLSHKCFLYLHSALCTIPLSLSPIFCIVQFTQSNLLAIPNTLLSVQYRSHPPLYAVLYSSLSQTCLLYQTLWSLYSTALTLPKFCIVQFTQSHLFAIANILLSVQYHSLSSLYAVLYISLSPHVCCTKHCALCTVPLSLSPIFCILQFTQSLLFAVALCSL